MKVFNCQRAKVNDVLNVVTYGFSQMSQVIKAGEGFILFVASHGVLLDNQYYIVTHDYNGTVASGSLISSNEIVEMSKKIRSLSQLYIFDTCQAGGVDKNNNKKISVVELGDYSKQKTTDISTKLGHAQSPLIINFGRDNTLYELR